MYDTVHDVKCGLNIACRLFYSAELLERKKKETQSLRVILCEVVSLVFPENNHFFPQRLRARSALSFNISPVQYIHDISRKKTSVSTMDFDSSVPPSSLTDL